jgi:hypothetical protein
MNSFKYKLPILRLNKYYLNGQTKSRINNLKLNIYNCQSHSHKNQSILKLRNNNSFNNIGKIVRNNNTNDLENKNDEHYFIKKFLNQNVRQLKPIKNIAKCKSTMNLYKDKYDYIFKDELNYSNKNNKDDNFSYIFNKYNKKFGNNPNLNKITNINKHLIKDNENDTNGNFIYDDYNEEKKESITFILNNNNSKEFMKKRLTKDNNNENKIISQDNKEIDDFKYQGKKYNSPGIKNIKKIKYIQERMQHKNHFDTNINSGSQKALDVYNHIFMEKLNAIKSKISKNGKNLEKMNGLVESCLNDAKNKFELEIKKIFGSNFSKDSQ